MVVKCVNAAGDVVTSARQAAVREHIGEMYEQFYAPKCLDPRGHRSGPQSSGCGMVEV